MVLRINEFFAKKSGWIENIVICQNLLIYSFSCFYKVMFLLTLLLLNDIKYSWVFVIV